MRLALFLLAAYILGLALVPCGDIDVYTAQAYATACTQASDASQPRAPSDDTPADDDHHDDCTPFCACACCGVQVVLTPQHFLLPAPPLMPPPTAQPMSGATAWNSRPLGAAFQPPRV